MKMNQKKAQSGVSGSPLDANLFVGMGIFGLRSLLAIAMLVYCLSPFAHAGVIYVLSNNDDFVYADDTNFGTIDTTTGLYTHIVSFPTTEFHNLAWNPVAGNFFVTDVTGINNFGTAYLRTLSTTGVLSAPIGAALENGGTSTFHGLAYRDATSPLYAAEFQGDDTGTISQTAGGFTKQKDAQSMSAPLGGRYAILNDTLYFATGNSSNRFGTVNFETGVYTNINTSNASLKFMVLASDGTNLFGLYGDGTPDEQALYSIDPLSGNSSFITKVSGAGLGTYFHGAAFAVGGPAPVPEPASSAVVALLMGGAALRKWRKSKNKQDAQEPSSESLAS
jgi:hypothetical protein